MAGQVAKLHEVIPTKAFGRIHPFAFDCTYALKQENLQTDLLGIGYRTGLLGAGSFTGTVEGLRAVTGR